MSPIPGIVASQISGHLASPTSYDSIATVTVGAGGQSQIDFTSIPSTYKHLQVRIMARGGTSGASMQSKMAFNSDTSTANYVSHGLSGNGTSASASAQTSGVIVQVPFGRQVGSTGLASAFGVSVIDILDYTNTSKNKTSRVLTGQDQNGSGDIALASGLWLSTSAITTISFTNQDGANYLQYSSFALYGIKA